MILARLQTFRSASTLLAVRVDQLRSEICDQVALLWPSRHAACIANLSSDAIVRSQISSKFKMKISWSSLEYLIEMVAMTISLASWKREGGATSGFANRSHRPHPLLSHDTTYPVTTSELCCAILFYQYA